MRLDEMRRHAPSDTVDAVVIGTGAGGTTVLNTRRVNTPTLITDGPTTSSSERSSGSVVR